MTSRTVAVDLVAKVATYKREMDSAGRSTKDFKQELNEAAKAGKVSAMASEKAAHAAKGAGSKFSDTGKDAKALGKEMFDLEVKLRNASKEFRRTGQIDLDLAKTLSTNRSQLQALAKLRKDLLGFGDDDGVQVGRKIGAGMAGGVVDSFSKAMSSGGTTFVGAVVGAIALAAPFIGASLAAAVLGTSGTLGIAGGVAMAARDPRVQDAARTFGATFMLEFGHATEPFVGATVEALRHLQTATVGIAADLRPAFEGLADHVAPLADAFSGLVSNMLPGFKDGLEAAEDVLGALERALPELGDDLGEMFEAFAENPEAAAAAMHDLVTIIGETARGIGTLTRFLSSYYEVLIKVGAVTTGWANDMPNWVKAVTPLAAVADYFDQTEGAMKGVADTTPHVSTNLAGLGNTAEDTAGKVRTLSDAIEDQVRAADKWFNRTMDAGELADRYEESIDDLTESIEKNGATLDVHTEKGRANRDVIRERLQVIKDERDMIIETTGDVAYANQVYQERIDTLYREGEALGLSRQAIDEVAAAIRDIPRLIELEIRAPGLIDALNRARELNRLLGNISAGARARGGDTSGYGGGRAGGGDMYPGMWYTTGEEGIELVQMHPDGSGATVYSNSQSRAMMSGASGGWYGNSIAPMGGMAAPAQATTIVVQLIDPMSGKVMRQTAIDYATSRGVAADKIRAANP